MDNLRKFEISIDEYRKIEVKADTMCEEELIASHMELVNKTCKSYYYDIEDCGVTFIKNLLSLDFGRTFVYRYTSDVKRFLKSKYLSDYFKNSIKELLIEENLDKIVSCALDGDKMINDMNEEEIKAICLAIEGHYSNPDRIKKANVASCFMSFLYKLDGDGVIAYIKNNVSNSSLATHILYSSGLNANASYYSGRGVKSSDLNEINLAAIFEQLLRFDVEYAINFVEMVRATKTLGATEFINSFYNFAMNDFKNNALNIEKSNISLGGLDSGVREVVACFSIVSDLGNSNKDYQVMASESMKKSFMLEIRPVLSKIMPSYDIEYEKAGYYDCYRRRR